MGRYNILSLNDIWFRLLIWRKLRKNRTYCELYLFCRGASNANVVLLAKIIDDICRQFVSCYMDAGSFYNAAKGYDDQC